MIITCFSKHCLIQLFHSHTLNAHSTRPAPIKYLHPPLQQKLCMMLELSLSFWMLAFYSQLRLVQV